MLSDIREVIPKIAARPRAEQLRQEAVVARDADRRTDVIRTVTEWIVAEGPGRLHGVALLDAGIPGITLPDVIRTDPERAWKTWHLAFHLVP
jgi:hypothetical protein